MKEFDAAEIAHDVGELYEPLAEEKGLALKVEADAPAPVKGNRELVSQALANLVDNAIKYAGPNDANGRPAEIVVRALNAGDRIVLTVADHGPGIPQADRARAVERFVRLEQSRSQPGSGLGLSLAAAVARLHGGELMLEDNQPGLKSSIALPRGGPVQTRDDAARSLRGRTAVGDARRAHRHRAAACRGAASRSAQSPSGWPVCRPPRPRRSRRCWLLTPLSSRCWNALSESSPYLVGAGKPRAGSPAAPADCGRRPALRSLLSEGGRAAAASTDEADAMRLLRRMKAEAALLIALADLGGVWPVMRVTPRLTELADTAVAAATRFVLREAVRAGRLKPKDPAQPEIGSGYIVVAMGKMGRLRTQLFERYRPHRLLRPRTRRPCATDDRAGAALVRITQQLVKLLQERTGDGYVFRIDLRLRPDPASTPVAISTDAALVLLREHRPELGARRHDQGARLRRRSRRRRSVPRRARALRLAQISRFRRASPTSTP